MTEKELDSFDPRKYIVIKGARLHNLKNINLAIPQKKLVVITGLSGSGKSSLAFDTLYAEGQRRYVESLSSYARQFLGRLDKPEVDWIKGISPAVAIEQKVTSRNPRSTVGTSTEIYDYLKVLFARIGRTFSPETGTEVKRHRVSDVLQQIYKWEEGTRFYITCPVPFNGRGIEETLKILEQQGFSRLLHGEEVQSLGEFKVTTKTRPENLQLVIDRAVVKKGDEDQDNRMADSIQTAFYEGHGLLQLVMADFSNSISFSNSFEADGITFEEPSLHLFSFNNPYGACKTCEGFGSVIGIDEDLVIPNPTLSVFEEAIAPWKGEKMSEWREPLLNNAHKFDFPLHRAYLDLSAEEKELLWSGNKHFKGLRAFFKYIESKSYKIQYRVMLSRYRGKTQCGTCNGTRLRPESSYVKIDQSSIVDLVDLSIDDLVTFFKDLSLTEFEGQVAKRLLIEINNRLSYLQDVGLGYLTLNRVSGTLSGGESQRINLATSLGSSLVGSMYILDEPSIGLHPRDTQRLIKVVKNLRDHGNTVIVVEHDEEFMKAADYIIDIGPGAGRLGGEIINTGTYQELIDKGGSLTAEYLRGDKFIELPENRRTAKHFIEIQGARENNLKGVDIRVPLEAFTVVTGVSGSGKSSLIKKILYPALSKRLGGYGEKTGKYTGISGAIDKVQAIEFVDQNPIGKSSRSNPVTYLKAYDDIRALFSQQSLSKIRNFKPKHFSFNTDGGRCESCKGEGEVTIEMQFMADVHLLCETCNGKRFKEEVLEVQFAGKSIFDILELTVNEAIEFFEGEGQTKIAKKIKPLQEVGLGYIHLGQSSSTLSGGEAQRVKLASFLVKGTSSDKTLFIFDEPTTGLHFDDIKKLLTSFNALIDRGHSVLVIEHNTDVIKCADWLIDLGPEGGNKGGSIVFEGEPKDIFSHSSHTADALVGKL